MKIPIDRPFFIPGTHPVELGDYVIVTAPIFKLFTLLRKCVTGLKSGCIVYGESRVGKTWSIKALTTLFSLELGYNSILCHDMLKHQKPTEKEFFRNILTSFGHARADEGNAGKKFDILVEFLVSEANKNPFRRLLLFIDEAQWLKEIEFGYLRGLYNVLQKRHVIPMFVLVGDYNLFTEFHKYTNMKNKEITGRFMSEVFQFRGIMKEEEVRLVLNGYDKTEAPAGSGWTYTRYFFPTAYDSGWRLDSQAKMLFNTYTEIMREGDKEVTAIEMPMSHLAPAVQHLLTTYGDLDIKQPLFSREAWYEALDFVIRPARKRRRKKNEVQVSAN